MAGALRRSAASATAAMTPSTAACHTNWSRAHPIAWATGCRASRSMMLIVFLLLVTVAAGFAVLTATLRAVRGLTTVEQPANLAEFLGARAARCEGLHHELGRRTAERPIEQVGDQLALGLPLGHPRRIHMRPVRVVSTNETLFRHDLEQLQRRGVGPGTIAGQHVVDLPHRARATRP